MRFIVAIIFSFLFTANSFANTPITKKEIDFTPHPLGTIVIKTSERRLYYSLGNGKAYQYQIAVGTEGNQWTGSSVVTRKAENPAWYPTPDQRKKNPKLPQMMEGGGSNPLGVRAIYLGWSALRVHGTIAPHSIGHAASNGCYRMHNADVIDLYKMVHIGAPVIVEE